MEKDFDAWNKEKKVVDLRVTNRDLFFYAREVWWCSAGLNVGVEADGKHDNFERPMLIVKKFNADMIWVLPLTSTEKHNKYYFKLTHESLQAWVVLSQIKTISTKRLLRKMVTVSESDFAEIIQRVRDALKIESPRSGDSLGGRSH